jgi:hypothetical protein
MTALRSSRGERTNECVDVCVLYAFYLSHTFVACTITTTLAWARSQNSGKAERAMNLFCEMNKLYLAGNKHLRPNVVAVNAVMNACAYTTGDDQAMSRALEIAHTVLQELKQSPYGNPDQVTYGTFLQVCHNQLPVCDSRSELMDVLFKKCCKDGQVGSLVLQQLKTMATDEEYRSMIGRGIDEPIKMEDLPKEWWCNVVEGKWRRRRIVN